MWKRVLWAGGMLVLVGAGIVFFGFGPGYMDRSMNRVGPEPVDMDISPRARLLHGKLTIVDLHADPLLWRRDLLRRHDPGHTDLPRLQDGNVALQVFSSVTKSPAGLNYEANPSDSDMLTPLVIASLQPPATWSSLYQRAVFHARKLEGFAAGARGQLQPVRSVADLQRLLAPRAAGSRPVGGLLALEGAHPLEGDPDNLDGLFEAGYRMIGMAHFFDNDFAGSMHGMEKYGLTARGRRVVERAGELGMVVDLAHSSAAAVEDILALATGPVVVSHGGVKATCDYNRNLSDEQVLKIAALDGVIGIGYWDAAVCDTTPAGIVAAMNHVRDLVGVEHLALGSDFDGATTVRFDTSELVYITQALLDAGYDDDAIGLIMGGNALRVLRAVLPAGGGQDGG